MFDVKHSLVTRTIVGSLVIALLGADVALLAQVSTLPTDGTANQVQVNRTVPDVAAPAQTLTFSDQPTTDEIFRARIFAEPLVPIGEEPSPDDTAALADALSAYHAQTDRGWIAPLGDYLTNHPDSPWRASLLANIGTIYREMAAFTRAMDCWDTAWTLTKDRQEPFARAVADYAISNWLEVAATFGQADAVEKRAEELRFRDVRGSAGARVAQAHQTAHLLAKYPDQVIASGPEALRLLLEQQGGTAAVPSELASYLPTAAGTSLAEIANLGRQIGLHLRPARRLQDAEVPVPSVIHWKLGHFSPVLERNGDFYRIQDVALGGTIWIKAAVLLDQSSEYALVPDATSEDTWRSIPEQDGAAIIGHSCIPGSPSNPPPSLRDFLCAGMCGYMLEPTSVSLQMMDTPVGYVPPRGPAVRFRLTYQQRELLQPQIFTYANVGPMWSFDWQKFLQEEPQQQICFSSCDPAHVWIYTAGGWEVFYDPNNDGSYDPSWRTRAIVVRVSDSPVRYERRLPDGSMEVYAFSDAAAAGQRRIFLTDKVDPQGQSVHLSWDSQFRLVAVTDAIGQVTTLSYADPSDALKLTKVTDPFGRSSTLTYTNDGQLASITDVLGITSSFAYGSGDFVATLTTPYGKTVFRHEDDWYNALSERMVEATDPFGETEHMEFSWRTAGMASTVSPSEVPTGLENGNRVLDKYNTFYWDKHAWKTAPGDKSAAVVLHLLYRAEFTGGPARNVGIQSIKRPLEAREWLQYPGQAYDYLGWLLKPSSIGRKLDDGASQVRQFTYDTYGNVLTEIDPLGRRTSYTYAANGADLLTVSQTTGTQNDLLASFSNYTAQHRPQTITDAAAQTTTVTYNSAGQPLTITNAKQETTTYGYDTDGRLTSVTGPVTGATDTFTYDAYGRVRTHTNEDGYTTTTDYDVFDRVTRITYPDGTYEAFTYDRLDLATSRDRLGRITRFYYDALRRLVGVRDPLGRTIQQVWAEDDALAKLLDAKGQLSWEQDLQGRITREVRDNGSATSYTYEPASGRLKTITDAKTQTKTYTYTVDDALTAVTYTNASIATPNVSYTYDALYPRLATMADGVGTTTYAYRAVGQLGAGEIASIDGPRANDTLTYTYDELGRATTRALNGVGVTWAYDALGRLSSEINPLGTFAYTYDGATPRLATATYPNGQTTTYTYYGNTGDRRLQTLHHKLSGGATLSKFDYTYDTVGNIRTWQQQADMAAPTVWTYGSDAGDQLTSAVKATTGGTPTIISRYGYAYDPAGNRTTEQIDDAVIGSTVDRLNRVVSQRPSGLMRVGGHLDEAGMVTVNGMAATVDAANNFSVLTPVAEGGNAFTVVARDAAGNAATKVYDLDSTGATRTFTYDGNGNLTSDGTRTFEWDAENRLVAVIVGTHRSEFAYNGEFHRTRIVEKENGATVRDAQLFWEDADIIEERLSTGEINRFFSDAETANGVARYVTRDHLESVREVTDATGAVLTRNDYDAYGRLTRVVGTEDSRFGFTGHFIHQASGLDLPQYRAYDPRLGRWLSEDPLQFDGGNLNLYGYVNGRPTVWTDRDGRIPVDTAIDIITTGIDVYCGNWTDVGLDVLSAVVPYLSAPALKAIRKGAKPSLSAHKRALKKVYDEVGKLRKGKRGKFGSPQAGDPKKGYRLDPPHPNAEPNSPEADPHFNWWDYTQGNKRRGGRRGAVPIKD